MDNGKSAVITGKNFHRPESKTYFLLFANLSLSSATDQTLFNLLKQARPASYPD
ncbi:hypothetical protein [Vibrio campbellii]|uniref:hypothetical protein n=1 Tax=Vibrio campbellii TaxID=680 RepID=UPI00210E4BFC|nr:hypothetical protein [Vibrio campbellii]UTZ23739.1 hypothetical protein HB760_18285 [Vibrio campbellii]